MLTTVFSQDQKWFYLAIALEDFWRHVSIVLFYHRSYRSFVKVSADPSMYSFAIYENSKFPIFKAYALKYPSRLEHLM